MTAVRIQPLAASTAMLAAEHARLDQAKAQLEKELAEMNVAQVPSGDDLVRALAEEIAAEEARTAAKREALARAEAALGTQQREAGEARARRRQEQHDADVEALQEAEARRLDAVTRIDEGVHTVAEAINEAVAALGEERKACVELASLAGRERVSLHGMDHGEFLRRIAARLVAILAQNVKGASHGLGRELKWSDISWTLEAKDGWPERERRLVAPAINELLNGRNTDNG